MNRLLFIGLYCLLLPELHAQVYQGLQVPFNLGRFGNTSPITQASGLALDPNGTSFWTHNDQGNPTTSIYKFLPATGNQAVTLQKAVNILSVSNLDWEDLAKDGNGNIYVCQIGKNCNENSDPNECPNRFVFKIHKIPLATLNHSDSSSVTPHTYYYKYPLSGYDVNNCQPDDTVFVNSEAAIWYQGALYVITKNIWSKSTNNCGGWQEGYAYLFKVNLTEGSTMQDPIVANYKGKFNLKINPNEPAAKYQVTAAAISPDSSTLALTTYGRVWLFRHFTADSFFNGTSMYVDYSGTGLDTITRGYEGIEFKNNHYLDVCVDGLNGRISGILIDSITLWVKHAGDAGPGSLRNAALCANSGDTIKFKSSLILDTIHLSTGPIVFNKNVRLCQPAGQHVFVESGNSSILSISSGLEIILSHIRFLSGDPIESGIINAGYLYLEDVEITQWSHQYPALTNTGYVFFRGTCSLH
ncbi:MAG: hypothetical protein IPL92_08495 [Saprospiraceae bacterium]|nr:hypothetical protein [Candidatus Opimibacter iunctus]